MRGDCFPHSLGLYWASSLSFSLGFLRSISRLFFRRLSYSPTPPRRPGFWCQVFDRGYSLAEVMSSRLLCQRCVTIDTGNVTLRTAGNLSNCLVNCTKLEFVRGNGSAKCCATFSIWVLIWMCGQVTFTPKYCIILCTKPVFAHSCTYIHDNQALQIHYLIPDEPTVFWIMGGSSIQTGTNHFIS